MVCTGPKVILDLNATNKVLETYSVTVIGYRCDELPAFYSTHSGLKLTLRLDTVAEIVDFYQIHSSLERKTAILVTNPPPESDSLPYALVDEAIASSLEELKQLDVHGKDVTPFLLKVFLKKQVEPV